MIVEARRREPQLAARSRTATPSTPCAEKRRSAAWDHPWRRKRRRFVPAAGAPPGRAALPRIAWRSVPK
jgi:hypothetical protein